jgi:hypothetical protein
MEKNILTFLTWILILGGLFGFAKGLILFF